MAYIPHTYAALYWRPLPVEIEQKIEGIQIKKNKLSSFTNNLITYIEDRWEIYPLKKKKIFDKGAKVILGENKSLSTKDTEITWYSQGEKKMNLPHTIHKNKIKVI